MQLPTPGALPLAAPPEPPTQEDLSGFSLAADRGVLDLIKVSARRAFRVRPDPGEVLRRERAALAAAQPPIVDAAMQGFLAWRRSVLLVVATLLVPLVVLRFVEVGQATTPDSLTGLRSMAVLAEAAFAVLAWVQLRNWTQWHRQRRALAWGVGLWFVAPFVVTLAPLRETAERPDVIVGMVVGLQALLTLAPRVLAIAPATLRAALVNRHLFPELTAPGKLIAIAAVVGALLTYVVLILPYQITGSGWFVLAIAGVIAAAFFLLRGRRREHLIAAGLTVLCAFIGFARLIDGFDLSVLAGINLLLSFAVAVLAGSLVATDALMAALDRGDGPRAATAPPT